MIDIILDNANEILQWILAGIVIFKGIFHTPKRRK